MCVYACSVYNSTKTRESGYASDRGARRCDCLSSSRAARKDPEMMSCRVVSRATFGLDKTENGTSKSHGKESYRENSLSAEPMTSTHEESQLVAVGRAIKDMLPTNPSWLCSKPQIEAPPLPAALSNRSHHLIQHRVLKVFYASIERIRWPSMHRRPGWSGSAAALLNPPLP